MNPLFKHWRFLLVGFFLAISIGSLLFIGVTFGIDFKGGTLYQIELQKEVTPTEIARIANIIQQRIDPGKLRGDILSPVGGKYIMIQTAETNPTELEKIESRIRQQGKFEATLNGELLFTGDEIKRISRKDGYGVAKNGNVYGWNLPFVLNDEAAKRFAQMTFHECTAISFSPQGKPIYDCERTMFFLDRPNALIVLTEEQYDFDEQELLLGNTFLNIPQGTSIDEVIEDSRNAIIIYENGMDFNSIYLSEVLKSTDQAIVSPDLSEKAINDLNAAGFVVTKTKSAEGSPWLWDILNAKQIIRLSEGITNEDVADPSQAKIFTQLNISGSRESAEVAFQDLEELAILLESGSLPTPVKSISKETISPTLGTSFVSNIIMMGIIALILVASIIIIRYKTPLLAVPIIITLISETIMMLGILALLKQPLDLAAFAGIIAAIGTSVDSEIVIVDEMIGKARKEHLSLLQKIKEGLFIITTSALTMLAVMMPIILLSPNMPGISNLYGFAFVAILGSLIGVLITRPAFTKVIEMISDKVEKDKAKTV
ncbi:MAG: hypothetical protein GX950_02305 [Candidatus Diapherotrites archaeon]|uniref:Protein export membrane protein SecD/SecF C-terminal domain-containing protein n=1 Tax=Candidatus Iainarchaeum sp. TaxID=3101447 RepID=A0A7K4BZD5_9ARCH|nr:hypothetical protein [Candidatus Diapherotrites archaeon]